MASGDLETKVAARKKGGRSMTSCSTMANARILEAEQVRELGDKVDAEHFENLPVKRFAPRSTSASTTNSRCRQAIESRKSRATSKMPRASGPNWRNTRKNRGSRNRRTSALAVCWPRADCRCSTMSAAGKQDWPRASPKAAAPRNLPRPTIRRKKQPRLLERELGKSPDAVKSLAGIPEAIRPRQRLRNSRGGCWPPSDYMHWRTLNP